MSVSARTELVRRHCEVVVNTGAVADFPDVIAPDYVEVHDGARHRIGLERARDHILGVRRTYPDLELRVDRQIAEGEWVARRVTMQGAYGGERLGIQPTGRRLTITAVNIDRVGTARIVEHGGAANLPIARSRCHSTCYGPIAVCAT